MQYWSTNHSSKFDYAILCFWGLDPPWLEQPSKSDVGEENQLGRTILEFFLKVTRVAFFTFNPESQNNMASYAIEGASRPDVDIDALPCNLTFIKINKYISNLLMILDVDREIDDAGKKRESNFR